MDPIIRPVTAPVSAAPSRADALDELVHYSRSVGADRSLVLRGGGNTSLKTVEADVAGRPLRVLRVKGSGSDLRTIRRDDFSGVRLDDALLLFSRAEMSDEEMVAYLARCLTDPGAPRPSIETLLHAFVPAASVFHTHADAILSLINTSDAQQILDEVFGDAMLRVAYRRPGFLLAREVGEAVRARPDARGLVLLNHGLVTWGDSPRSAYERHIQLVAEAVNHLARRKIPRVFVCDPRLRLDDDPRRTVASTLAPAVRGALGRERRVIARYTDSPEVLDFVGSERARRASAAGAATPDHILTTGFQPLWVDVADPRDGEEVGRAFSVALERYRAAYRAYVERWRTDEPVLDSSPRVVLIPGVGMWAAGRSAAAATLARDIFAHTIGIMAGAESISSYRSLSERDAFRAEYWPLELYKLTLAPPEREMARRIVLVTGGASGIGRAAALRLAAAGAQVVVTDRDAEGAEAVAAQIRDQEGENAAVSCRLDVTRPEEVDAAFANAALAYGGLDVVVSNAGIAHCAAIEELDLEDWDRSMAVNATGHFLVTRAALRLFRRQGMGGSLIFIATKNVTAPGTDFAAYSASKAAEAQLARVAALEGGSIGVRVNLVNPDAVFGDSRLWSPEIRARRARAHGIEPERVEAFYRTRNLLGVDVRAEDVAEAVLFLAGDRSSRTTGCMIPVDGGVREAFPR